MVDTYTVSTEVLLVFDGLRLKKQSLERRLIGSAERLTRSGGAGSESFRFWFAAVKLADDIDANAPERLLVGFLAFWNDGTIIT